MNLCVEGQCLALAAEDGMKCDDGDVCTLDDFCLEGACVGKKDPDCDPPLDQCQDKEDGDKCDDEDPCTLDDFCVDGKCVGESISPDCLEEDIDGDGFTVKEGDCDDQNADIHPGAKEKCNTVDDDCDGDVDEGVCQVECVVSGCSGEICAPEPMDSDCMWLPEYECLKLSVCGPFGEDGGCGWLKTDEYLECIDNIRVPEPEICDGKDNDCDGEVDEGLDCELNCGGIIGLACPDGMFCHFEDGTCGLGDQMGKCIPFPNGCEKIYKPVCGCDDKTYGNECEMMTAGMSKLHDGECEGPCLDKEICNNNIDDDCDGLVDEGCDECIEEGGKFEDFDTEGKCCPGLVPVNDCIEEVLCTDNEPPPPPECEVMCACPNCPCFVCTYCGDGECGLGENSCSCPEDCKPQQPNVCEQEGGLCTIPLPDEDGDGCPDGMSPVYLPGCDNGEICCIPDAGECIEEGGGGAVVPWEKECCPGLVSIPCDKPAADDDTPFGQCMPCDGAFFCTYCGDGVCKDPENMCNCPEDCKEVPPECASDKDCDDNDACTKDSCANGVCVYLVIPGCIPLQCGGIIGLACPDGWYCKFPTGACNVLDNMGQCTPIPDACILLWDPVCGCDGKTYGNECAMETAQQSMDYEGECKEPVNLCVESGGMCVGLPDDPNDEPVEMCPPGSAEVDLGGCENWEICCMPFEPECKSDKDCPDGQICDVAAGICMPLPDCENDADCPAGYYCSVLCGNGWCKGTCLPIEPPECQETCDCYDMYGTEFPEPCMMLCPTCDNYWQCDNGKCVDKCGPVPEDAWVCLQECASDKDCDDGDICTEDYCENGMCVHKELPNCNPDCVKEGDGYIGDSGNDNQCCEGLVPVWDCEEVPVDCAPEDNDCGNGFTCNCPKCLCFVCTYCGNGECGPGENKCSCPEDCLEEGECSEDAQCDDEDECTKDVCENGKCIHEDIPDCEINCWLNEQCPVGTYCRFPDGQCDNAKSGSCAAIPNGCFDLWKPVCGCDNKTYGNECEMQVAMQSLKHEGECKPDCVEEGEGYIAEGGNDNMCCEGLTPVPACIEEPAICDPNGTDCEGFSCACPNCLCFVCTYCGNGECGLGENKCNCPEDCLEEGECLTDKDCDDNDECTIDSCDQGKCVHKPDENCVKYCWKNDMCPKGQYCWYPDGECNFIETGQCKPIPQACPDVWIPVCGCDEKTYGNYCEMQAAQQSMLYKGECKPEEIKCGGIAGQKCPKGMYCKYPAGACNILGGLGTCTEIPEACPFLLDPVCGCDGETYANECLMETALVSMDYKGGCKNNDKCKALDPFAYGMCNMLLGVLFTGKECVYASGCSCGNDCDYFFDTLEECKDACL